MGLEQFLTEEDKVASLTDIRSFMYKELYAMCIRAGVDPDEFNYETWVQPEITEDNRFMIPIYTMLTQTCRNLKMIDKKLAGQ